MQIIRVKGFGLALCIATSLSACNDSPTSTKRRDSLSSHKSTTSPENDDAQLVSGLMVSMYGGIAIMQQGQTKAKSAAVKVLAKKLEIEDTQLTGDLRRLEDKKGWAMPYTLTNDDIVKRQKLEKEKGDDYDKAWLESMKDFHKINIKKLENYKTTDSDLKAAMTSTLAKLKELLSSIELVQKSLENPR